MTHLRSEQVRREQQKMEVTSLQERQLLGLREYYAEVPSTNLRVVDEEEPLERSRLYGPFDAPTMLWVGKIRGFAPGRIVVGHDPERRRDYIEY